MSGRPGAIASMGDAIASPTPPASASDRNSAVIASFLGWMLDAFDFFLVVYCLTAIKQEFHTSDAEIALSMTLTLAFRPLGAFIFGLMADRYGRRIPLMLDLVCYSVIEVLSGLAPNLATFMLLRALFGIGMGGEWGASASLTMEKIPPKYRGLLSGLLQQGYTAGALLAAIFYYFFFERLGWRPLFFIGGLPALLVAAYIFYHVKESAVWHKSKQESWSQLGRAIVPCWKLFVYITLLMMMMNCVSHGTQDMYPTFLKRARHFGSKEASLIPGISMVGACIGAVFFGTISDRWGRRRVMMIALLCGMFVIPLWAYAPTEGLLILGAFALQFMAQGAWGVIPAHLSELSPDAVRGFLPGFAYQCGVLLASPIDHMEALFAQHMSYATAMASTAVVSFALALLMIAVGGERRAAPFAGQ
jgi:MFS transporter, SHS family, lactate transporter